MIQLLNYFTIIIVLAFFVTYPSLSWSEGSAGFET